MKKLATYMKKSLIIFMFIIYIFPILCFPIFSFSYILNTQKAVTSNNSKEKKSTLLLDNKNKEPLTKDN